MAIKGKELIEKKNVLNELRSNNLTLQELRFFSIYLSKINARDIKTRVVRFSLQDFQKIMDFGRLNLNQLKATTNSLLSKVVSIPVEKGGYTSFQLFKECTVSKNKQEEWYVEIDAHDKALPLMFEFKGKYFTYQLWNALCLKSSNQVRMYEILKQYEKIGERTIYLSELRKLIGIELNEYSRWDNFKTRVLDVCQEALSQNTDIEFTYEPCKKGKGGKILELKFKIFKNNNYIDKLTLDEFIHQEENNKTRNSFKNSNLEFISEACNNEFSEEEMQVLYDLIKIIEPVAADTSQYDYLFKKYNELKYQSTKSKIKSPFAYLRKIIQVDIDVKKQL